MRCDWSGYDESSISLIIVAHNYVQVLQICDRVNLLQEGRIAFDKPTAETSLEELNELVVEEYRRARAALGNGAPTAPQTARS